MVFILLTCSKPKNQRSKRALEKRGPKLIENPKRAMFVRGGRISQTITNVMTDLVRCTSKK